MCLQSFIIKDTIELEKVGELKASTMALASNSITTDWAWICKHSCSPSQRAHNSAKKLDVFPILLAKPITQSLFSSLTSPAPLAGPKLLAVKPSVFKVSQPAPGFSHLMLFIIILLVTRALFAQKKNSKARSTISLLRLGFGFLCLKTHRFLSFQSSQILNKNTWFQGRGPELWWSLDVGLVISHSWRLKVKKLEFFTHLPSWCHTFLPKGNHVTSAEWILPHNDTEGNRHPLAILLPTNTNWPQD